LETVAFDESGNTGQLLTDPAQPVMTVASVRLSEDDAQVIVDVARRKLRGRPKELHFKRMWAYPSGQAAVLAMLDPATLSLERVKVCVTHKRFMTVGKMVDVLVEEMAFRNGHDLYSNGFAPNFANLLYWVTPVLADEGAFDATLEAFVDMARRRDQDALKRFYRQLTELTDSCRDPKLREYLGMLVDTRTVASDLLTDDYTDAMRDVLDPAVPVLVQLCRQWGEELGSFQVLHDASRVIASWESTLHRLGEIPDPARPDRRMPTLLIAPRLVFGDSRDYAALQVADVVAGATRHWLTAELNERQDSTSERLRDLVSSFISWVVWPTPPPGG